MSKTLPRCCVLLLVLHLMQTSSFAKGGKEGTLTGAELGLYGEALSLIRKVGIFVGVGATGKEMVVETIRAFLRVKDPFADYLTPEEYAKFKKTRTGSYAGFGADIEKGGDGSILCFPAPGSPAERAGIKAGDRLEKIDGTALRGASLFSVAALALGREGSKAKVKVRTGEGAEREVTVVRSTIPSETVSLQRGTNLSVIAIGRFSEGTRGELERVLKQTAGKKVFVIDVRGNRGGELPAAVNCARLFLKKGSIICSMKTRSGRKVFDTKTSGVDTATPLYIWQDGGTASAAEVFVAALTGNSRAVSIGKRSYGKGTRQDVVALRDGSAVVLTTGYLQTPAGAAIEGKGVNPTYALQGKSPGLQEYEAQTTKLVLKKGR